MSGITVGVLTVSDSRHSETATDESGPALVKMVEEGIIKDGKVLEVELVPDDKEAIKNVLKKWCEEGIHLILTTGGTGLSQRDVTPEATVAVSEKLVLGISHLMFRQSLNVTPFAALSRAVAGVRGKTLIINLPGSKKGSRECLEVVAEVIPHAVHLLRNRTEEVEKVHGMLRKKKSSVIPGDPTRNKTESPYPCISVVDAQEMVLRSAYLLRKETYLDYDQAFSYVLAQDVLAKDFLPPFDVSLKDGFAVLANDPKAMLPRRLIGVSNAGDSVENVTVLPGSCVRVSTGAAIPPGANAVVQVEDTAKLQSNDETLITMKISPVKGANIRCRGSDFKKGEMLLRFGSYLSSASLGVLAASGVTSLRVFKKPLVAVMSTGDELINPKENLRPGKVRDSNRITLINLLKEENFQAVDLGIVPDTPDELRDSLEKGFREADVVVTTGSMSMGERDYLKEVLVSDFEADICFGRVMMKPGKPTAFGIVNFEGKEKLWFGLPGNPASAFVTSHLFLLPALKVIAGLEEALPAVNFANLARVCVGGDRPEYVRGILSFQKGEFVATPLSHQESSNIAGCVDANCLILIPEGQPRVKNAKVWRIGKIRF